MTDTHVTLKVVSGNLADRGPEQLIRMRSGPSVNHVRTPWSCGNCSTYTSKTTTYRVIAKACPDHAFMIPPKPEGKPKRGREQR